MALIVCWRKSAAAALRRARARLAASRAAPANFFIGAAARTHARTPRALRALSVQYWQVRSLAE